MKKDISLKFAESLLCGGFAGVASRSITSPLDVVKILAQVGSDKGKSLFGSFLGLYRAEGLKSFWKGNGVACLRLFPYNAIQFAAFGKLKKIFSDSTGNLPAGRAMVSGALGGLIATIATYPMDLAKTRLTVQHADPSIAKYKGIVGCLHTIVKEEGVKALFTGLTTSVTGVIPYAGGTFMAYEILQRLWDKPRSELNSWQNFVNGCAAGAFAQTFSYPFDTIRKKLQAQAKVGHDGVEYKGMIDGFVKTVKNEGFFALYRGTSANLAKLVPYAGIVFSSFEACSRVCLSLRK